MLYQCVSNSAIGCEAECVVDLDLVELSSQMGPDSLVIQILKDETLKTLRAFLYQYTSHTSEFGKTEQRQGRFAR